MWTDKDPVTLFNTLEEAQEECAKWNTGSVVEYPYGVKSTEVPCKTHPDAPHGFDRTSSHSLGRYVCECEGWIEDE